MTSRTDPSKMSERIPRLTAKGDAMGACFEIHIFMGEILTFTPGTLWEEVKKSESYKAFDAEAVKYVALVEKWNTEVLPMLKVRDQEAAVTHTAMKKPKLVLIFRNPAGEVGVGVCQSARHVWASDMDRVLQLCHEDAEYFRSNGMKILREKIEASAHGIQGIPQTDEEAIASGSYFEFHIKTQLMAPTTAVATATAPTTTLTTTANDVQNSSGNVVRENSVTDGAEEESVPETKEPQLLTQAEEKELRSLADELSRQFGIPIPLSYNLEKNENNTKNGGCQRFLNARFRNIGMQKIEIILLSIKKRIAATRWPNGSRKFVPLPMISEFIVYDTNTAMDYGWIDYSDEEAAALQKRLQLVQ